MLNNFNSNPKNKHGNELKTQTVVSPNWLNENLNNANLVVLDASPKSNVSGLDTEFSEIQIKKARYFDLDNKFSDPKTTLPHMLPTPTDFEKEARKLGINNTSEIVVYDNLGIYSSPRVWWMFKVMGHINVKVLDGGLPAWVKLGFETEPIQTGNYTEGNFISQYHSKDVKDFDFVKMNLESQKSIIIDARSNGRFNGTAPEPREWVKSGHIPNSINIPFESLLENGKFKSKDELKTIFQQHDLKNRELVFSCGSGLTACINLLAAEIIMDNPKSVYDGSWTEWAQRKNAPIV